MRESYSLIKSLPVTRITVRRDFAYGLEEVGGAAEKSGRAS